MKKFYPGIAICLLLCLLLGGCSNVKNGPSDTQATPTTVTGEEGKPTEPVITEGGEQDATPTPTEEQDLTPAVTEAPGEDPSEKPEATPEVTEAPEATNTPEPTPEATEMPVPTMTSTPVPTATATPKPTATATPKPTATSTPKPTATPTVVLTESLYKHYANDFRFGTCVSARYLNDSRLTKLVLQQFNSITCENEMKPDALLDQYQSRAQGKVVVTFTYNTTKILDWAKQNNLKMRGHVLVWHSQTPEWFFREGFQNNGALVSREEMLARMESYIQQVFAYCDSKYPGLFYAWDVVNEAFTDDGDGLRNSNWYKIFGEDFIIEAFRLARKYAPSGVKLFYNDFNTYINYSNKTKTDRICNLVTKLKAEGLIDGVGMQSHLDVSFPSADAFVNSVKRFSGLGVEVQITELDVTTTAGDAGLAKQATYLESIFKQLVKNDRNGTFNITSVTVWGVADNLSWRAGQRPLLFDANLNPKPAYFSVLQ